MMLTFLVTPATLMISFTTTIVFAVTAVHEEVHEWTRQEKQIRQDSKQVPPVFGEQEEGDDCQEDKKHDVSSRTEPTTVC